MPCKVHLMSTLLVPSIDYVILLSCHIASHDEVQTHISHICLLLLSATQQIIGKSIPSYYKEIDVSGLFSKGVIQCLYSPVNCSPVERLLTKGMSDLQLPPVLC